jgi:hypothetical protein
MQKCTALQHSNECIWAHMIWGVGFIFTSSYSYSWSLRVANDVEERMD